MKRNFAVVLAGAWMAFFGSPSLASACAVCLGGAGDATTDAFKWSMVFLMAMPYMVAASIAGCLVYTYRRSAASEQRQEAVARPHAEFALYQEESAR